MTDQNKFNALIGKDIALFALNKNISYITILFIYIILYIGMSSISTDTSGRLFIAEQRIFEIEKELRLVNGRHNELTTAIQNMSTSNQELQRSIEQQFQQNNSNIQTYIDSKFADLYARLFPQQQVLAQV